ncbi:MAG: hypothetical protein EXR72_25015 [Myxococcales bacterium]|nr:hypothetical protein [Myxococcales bacterium]
MGRVISSRRSRLALVLVVLAAWGGARADKAEDRRAGARAQALFNAGKQRYAEGDFAQALADFQEAHRLTGEPILLLSIGHACRRLGAPRSAAIAYRRYLQEVASAADRVEVERWLAEAESLAKPPAPPPIVPPGTSRK